MVAKPPAPPPPVIEPFAVPPGEPKHKRVLSRRFQLSIALPDRSGWMMVRDKSSFLVMDHPATRSRLLVRVWRDDDFMNHERCEQKVRLIRDVPASGRIIGSAVVEVPAGFSTHVDVGVAATQPGDPVAGHLLAFGASGRRCFAMVFTTEASGDGAEGTVGDRLAVIQSLTLERVELRSELHPVR